MSSSSGSRRLSARCFFNLAAAAFPGESSADSVGGAPSSMASRGGGRPMPSSGGGFLHLEKGTNQMKVRVRQELEQHLDELTRVVKSAGAAANRKKEGSVYVGSPGMAYAFLKLAAYKRDTRRSAGGKGEEEEEERCYHRGLGGGEEEKKRQRKALMEVAQNLLSEELLQSSLLQAKKHPSLGPSLLCGPAGLYLVLAIQAWQKEKEESLQDDPSSSRGDDATTSSSATSSSSSPPPSHGRTSSPSTSSPSPSSSPSSSSPSQSFLKAVKGYESYYSYALDKLDSDEWLYGRVGYLYGLLFLNYMHPSSVSNSSINDLAVRVLESGIECGRQVGVSPLMYSWHEKYYLGAAHGVLGILYILMLVPSVRRDLNAMRYVKGTLDWILTLETENQNYPACFGETQDYLCHFCHGATGAVFTFSVASVIFNHRDFQKAALRAAECVWRYGLLKKGSGICHGISGSGYALLAVYKLTRDPIWLDRAIEFALKMFDEKLQADSRIPDNPFSLFEGLSGAICFLVDLLHNPLKSSFPFFELGF
ncbi:lanthionine synthetase c family protein [Cystoisospora suis]|uniref:Lanthionine synthetase c family protein n=1 Tax=Cystoisospora suis TaxID=483139 RepID=A0A2C6L673_9APIC|nr:lanthionine synthetase c family protein [Cystoisospora suis]